MVGSPAQRPRRRQKRGYRRSKSLILPRLQLSLVMSAVFVFALASVIYFAAVHVVFLRLGQLAAESGFSKASPFMAQVDAMENTTALVYGVTVLVGIVIIFVGGIRLSHRVAGPIFFLNGHMAKIARGETLANVRFRKNDFLLDTQDRFNEMLQWFRESQGQTNVSTLDPSTDLQKTTCGGDEEQYDKKFGEESKTPTDKPPRAR